MAKHNKLFEFEAFGGKRETMPLKLRFLTYTDASDAHFALLRAGYKTNFFQSGQHATTIYREPETALEHARIFLGEPSDGI